MSKGHKITEVHAYHIHPMHVVQQKEPDTTVMKCHQFVSLICTKMCTGRNFPDETLLHEESKQI